MGDKPDPRDNDITVGGVPGTSADWDWTTDRSSKESSRPAASSVATDEPDTTPGPPNIADQPEDKTEVTVAPRSMRQPRPATIDEGLRPPPGQIHVLWRYFRFALEYIVLRSQRRQFNELGMRIKSSLTQKIYVVHNTKGGSGKSALTSWLFGELGGLINRSLTAFDCNAGAGSTTSRFGIHRSATIWLRDYLKRCKDGEMDEAEDFLSFVGWHNETGVSVIASDPDNDDVITQKDMHKGLGIAKAHSHSVICDLGNQIRNASSIIPLRMANTLIFVGNVNMANSLPDLNNTRRRVARHGLMRKVEAGIIVIIGAKLSERAKYAQGFDVPIKQVFVIPNNRYMKEGRPVKLIMLPLRIRVILRQIIIAAMEAPTIDEETTVYRQRYEPTGEAGINAGTPRGLDDIEVFNDAEMNDEDEEDDTGPDPDQISLLDS